MKWNITKNKPKIKIVREPIVGDVKCKVKFAFLPTKINKEIIWLEKYIQLYQYDKVLTLQSNEQSRSLTNPHSFKFHYFWKPTEKLIYDPVRENHFNKL